MQTELVRLVVLGDGGVGKSALTLLFTTDQFVTEYDPTIEDTYRKQVIIDGESFVIDIADTAGAEDFSAMRLHLMSTGETFLYVYSIDSRASFDEIHLIVERVMDVKKNSLPPGVLCGNKIDLAKENRQVSFEEGADLAKSFGFSFFETSAKSRSNVEEAFVQAVMNLRSLDRKEMKLVNFFILQEFVLMKMID